MLIGCAAIPGGDGRLLGDITICLVLVALLCLPVDTRWPEGGALAPLLELGCRWNRL